MLKQSVNLVDGIEFDGKKHKTVVLRGGIVRDVISAEKATGDRGMVYLSLALLCEQCVSVGDIPKEKITPDLLAMLTEEDFERLQEAREVLKKKARWEPREENQSA